MKNANWENWGSMILGVWFFLTPWVLSSKLSAESMNAVNWNSWLIGLAIALSAYSALRDLKPWEEWLNLALGVWVCFSPWIYGYGSETSLMWNSVVVGLAVVVMSGAALPIARKVQH